MSDETQAPHYAGMSIHQRIHAVMERVRYIQKSQPKKGADGGLKYSILNYNSLVAKVRPLFVEFGIMIYPVESLRVQTGNRTEIDMTVRFVCVDDPGSFLDVPSSGYGVDAQDKGPGKARTYSIKSAVRDVLFLESGDDPDDDQSAAADHSAVDPAVEQAAEQAARTARAERIRLHKRAVSMARQCGYPDPETAVKDWLTSQTGAMPFLEIPLDTFEQAAEYFAEHPLDTPKGD